MESFDIKMLEFLNNVIPMSEEDCKNAPEMVSVRKYVSERINKLLEKYFIFVKADPHDPESISCYCHRPTMFGVTISGKVVIVDYKMGRNCYVFGDYAMSWDRLFVTEKEAIDSITKKRK